MNRQIMRVGWTAMGLLVALVVATTYWQTWARADLGRGRTTRSSGWRSSRSAAGRSSTPDRRSLARNTPRQQVGRKTLYFRRYPQGKLTAHVVGYSTVGRARAGLERSLNDVLTGTNRGLGSLVDQTLDELGGKPIVGDAVATTIDLERAAGRASTSSAAAAAPLPRSTRVPASCS